MTSDERLVKRATRGDARAFEQIYQRYYQDLYRFCLAMLGNPQDAQDVLQNTMVKVLRALPGEEREIKLKPWLYRIARNESVEALRRRRDERELDPQQVGVAGPAETAETRARLRQLLDDLEQLPERQRAVLTMRELSGLGFAEIAASLGTSEAVARQTLYEARLSLRQLEGGREMPCAAVQKELSDADGRVTRRREIRAHLRSCAECRAFQDEIERRRRDLAALAPLPVAASAGLLHSLLSGDAAAKTIGGAGGSATSIVGGSMLASSTVVKSVAVLATAAAVGVGADRSGLVHLPRPGGDGGAMAGSPGGASAAGPIGPAAGPGAGRAAADGTKQSNGEEGGDKASHTGAHEAKTTRSAPEAELNPVGGGHGRTAAEPKGAPEALPPASERGQQTAGENKPSEPGKPDSVGGKPPQAEPPPPPVDTSPPTPQPGGKPDDLPQGTPSPSGGGKPATPPTGPPDKAPGKH